MKKDDELKNEAVASDEERTGNDVSRRSFVVTTGLSLLGGSALSYGVSSAEAENAARVSVTEEELAPFKKIAKEKGAQLVLLGKKEKSVKQMTEMHLDMDMVRASLDNAIERAKKQNLSAIQPRLERLRTNGTASQQIDFVLGSGHQYMFPEDVEKIAAQAEKDKFHTFGVGCGLFCWLSCICTGEHNQECRERCREVVCPNG